MKTDEEKLAALASETQNVQVLLAQRQVNYGDTWKLVGKTLLNVSDAVGNLLVIFPEGFYSWIMIYAKLLRILVSPHLLDNWKDIEGYAHLVRTHLEDKNAKASTYVSGK